MPKPVRSYPVSLVGLRGYQAAIGAAAIGDAVHILSEPDNPHDGEALVVVDGDGRALGYVPRVSWLRVALTAEGRGCRATVDELKVGDSGYIGVQLLVTLNDDGPIGTRSFVPAG